jgi:hypothetical protein
VKRERERERVTEMRPAIVGSPGVGGNIADQLARAGFEPLLSLSRDQEALACTADA